MWFIAIYFLLLLDKSTVSLITTYILARYHKGDCYYLSFFWRGLSKSVPVLRPEKTTPDVQKVPGWEKCDQRHVGFLSCC